MPFLDIATITCVGLLIGNEVAVSAFINPILWRLEDGAQLRAVSMFAKRLGTAMPFWYVFSLVLLLLEAALRRTEAGDTLIVVSCAIWAAVIVLTILFLVPINNRLARMEPDLPPQSAKREHKRWDALHRLRIVALTASLVCFLVGGRL
jgi:uncharacterized membrane protein